MADLQHIAKWDRWLESIKRQVIGLHAEAHVFWGVQDVIRANTALHVGNAFFDLLANSYAASTAVAIRRQVDRDPNVISLRRLLEEIQANPGAITRKWYLDLYADSGLPAQVVHRTFDKYAGKGGASVDPAVVGADLARLMSAPEIAKVKRYADKRVAHFNRGQYRNPPTYSDLKACLVLLEEMLKRYVLLARGEGLVSATPVFQYDWQDIFRIPWIQPAPSTSAQVTEGSPTE